MCMIAMTRCCDGDDIRTCTVTLWRCKTMGIVVRFPTFIRIPLNKMLCWVHEHKVLYGVVSMLYKHIIWSFKKRSSKNEYILFVCQTQTRLLFFTDKRLHINEIMFLFSFTPSFLSF